MKDYRIDVCPVRPHDRAKFLVYLDLSEQIGIIQQRLEDRPSQKLFHVNLAGGAVVERQPQVEASQDFYRCDVN